MQLFLRSDRTRVVQVDREADVRDLMDLVRDHTGMPVDAQVLSLEGRLLAPGARLNAAGVTDGSTVRVSSRLRGGAQPITLIVRPRVQRERWSLYWKETMATKTELLKDMEIRVDPASATGSDILKAVGKALGWQNVEELLSLEGFEGPWERLIVAGRELELAKPLAEQGVTQGATLVAVRLALSAEGWKLQGDAADDSSEDEEEGWTQTHPSQISVA